ncbi:hypothetical protein BKA80DRAFT_74835 [Phyllosticta citrichinensis]
MGGILFSPPSSESLISQRLAVSVLGLCNKHQNRTPLKRTVCLSLIRAPLPTCLELAPGPFEMAPPSGSVQDHHSQPHSSHGNSRCMWKRGEPRVRRRLLHPALHLSHATFHVAKPSCIVCQIEKTSGSNHHEMLGSGLVIGVTA